MKCLIPVVFEFRKHLLLMVIAWACSFAAYSQVEIKVTDASCNGKEDGKIDVTVSGKNAPYTYLWSDGSTEDHLYDIPKGTYHLVITDKDGCIYEKSIAVGVLEDKPKVKISGGGDRTFCEDEEIRDVELTAVATVCAECELKWSTGSTDTKIQVSSDGNYSVVATDSSGCFESDSTDVKIEIDDCDDDDDDDEPEVDIPVQQSRDPNDMLGPEGVGRSRWVSVNAVLPYTIRFENDPVFATAPAQRVTVRSALDPDLNIYSFRLGSFGFGSFVFDVPVNSTYYTQRLDVTDSLNVVVDVIAGIDVVKKEAFWIFESRDPENGNVPAAHLGFLLINDSITHKGEGFVSFTIQPDPSANTGDSIHAIADIVFDDNESIWTPVIFNTIDALPPVSTHRYSEALIDSFYHYSVFAQDDYGFGGSGVHSYDLYISEDRGLNYNLHASKVPVDSMLLFKGNPGKQYCAYTIARDSVGNKEWKALADSCFSVKGDPFVKMKDLAPGITICQGSELEIEWESLGVDSLLLLLSSDNGNTFSPAVSKIPARQKRFYWEVPYDVPADASYLIKLASVSDDEISDTANTAFQLMPHQQVTILSDAGSSICEGASAELTIGKEYFNYRWSTGEQTRSITVVQPGAYVLEANDENGCSGKDTFFIHSNPDKPVLSPAGPYKICPGRSVALSAPAGYETYLWSTGGATADISLTATGKVYVKVTDAHGCSATSDTTVATEADESECGPVSTNDPMVTHSFVKVSPNPLSELAVFEILLPQTQTVTLSLYDSKGMQVMEIFNGQVKGGKLLKVDFKPPATIPGGLYVYKLLSAEGELYNDKLIISR